jgi:hypothetical protein
MSDAIPDRPERLSHPLFNREEPVELLYERIEAVWALIAEADDWSGFEALLSEIAAARAAWGF